MAEFCKECFRKIFGEVAPEKYVEMSTEPCTCERCMETKPYVVKISNKTIGGMNQ